MSKSYLSGSTGNLPLSGGVPPRFRPFFDLYPIEVSTTLTDWTPLTTLVRSNASTNALFYVDTGAVILFCVQYNIKYPIESS